MNFLNKFELLARRINVKFRLIIAFTLILMLVTGVMGIYATSIMSQKILTASHQKLKSDLALGKEIINEQYPGDWHIQNGKLYKGSTLIENNYQIIDLIGKSTGDNVTIFCGDTRVATNVTKNGQRQVGTQASAQVVQTVLKQGQTYIGRADVVGVWNETAYEPIKDAAGNIIGIWFVGVPSTPYDDMVNHFRWSMIGYSGVGILVGFLAAVLIAYTVHAPLRRINQGIERASEGDLSIMIPQKSDDELGRLANRVNKMMAKMAELIGKTQHLISTIVQSNTLLLNNSQNCSAMMQNMTDLSGIMSANAGNQADMTNQSRQAINEMSAAVQQLAQNAQEVASSALTAHNKAENGQRQVGDAIEQIGVINQTVNTTAGIVADLGNKSQEVGQIVDLITSIADQTNLLALNAAIEAARAGEQGRGFAVVAEEVRKLAEESGEAAKRIAILINEVQYEANRAVSAMQDGTREVSHGTKIVASTGDAFEQIIQAFSTVNQQVQEMSAASQEMAASAETALYSIQQTYTAADQNAADAQNVKSVATEQMAKMQEVAASVEKMTEIIDELNVAIAYFTV
ncbi:Chemotaxis methyl-accepting receptor [Syntrophomonas zehnderi OL-4]|uniref:Chemotaxis methyl-accepting receptor n=1 Tax=Syntrophomonas zehnderi OL-4 TaxID=690567 RepID=A0A0E4G9W2_9FIRM|nr:methyl-accepting chemotaxis protein [Syntrophomonas zehnderi]CFX26908.1 Chemotaxis methyl-accepting receptor [Syntrophomonas zehnderi OL-4]